VNSAVYRYRYYNCRTFCRVGSTACAGGRIPVAELDAAVLKHIVALVCSEERCDALLLEMNGRDRTALHRAWWSMVTAGGMVSRNYLLHLIERIELRENEITIVPRSEFAAPLENPKKTRPWRRGILLPLP
jgi:hypothetical protein